MQHELRVEVTPPWPFRLRGGSADGLLRRRGASLQRLLHRDGAPVHVAVIQPAPGPRDLRRPRGLRAGRDVGDPAAALRDRRSTTTCARSTSAFRDDPVIGKARPRASPSCACGARRCPGRRSSNAVTEQLIEFERAVAIQRRHDRRARRAAARGPGCATRPTPAAIAAHRAGPARGDGPRAGPGAHAAPRRRRGRVRARRPARRRPAARLAAAARDPGRRAVDARDARAARPGPLRPRAGGRPRLPQARRPHHAPATRGRAPTRPEVRAFFERYGEWKGLAGEYLRARRRARPAAGQSCESVPGSSPSPARNSFVSARSAICGRVISPLVEHPVGVALPLRRILVAERPLGVGGEEHRQRRLHDRLLQPAVEPRVGLEQPVDARPPGSSLSIAWPRAVACMKRRTRAPNSSSRSRRRTTNTSSA